MTDKDHELLLIACNALVFYASNGRDIRDLAKQLVEAKGQEKIDLAICIIEGQV